MKLSALTVTNLVIQSRQSELSTNLVLGRGGDFQIVGLYSLTTLENFTIFVSDSDDASKSTLLPCKKNALKVHLQRIKNPTSPPPHIMIQLHSNQTLLKISHYSNPS